MRSLLERHQPVRDTSDSASGSIYSNVVARKSAEADEQTISQMAESFDVTMRTLRFYEQKGLLQPRRVGKRRLYNEASRERLRLVLKGKAMGFGLDEIVDLVAAVESNADEAARAKAVQEICENQRNILQARRNMIDEQIEQTTLAINGLLPL